MLVDVDRTVTHHKRHDVVGALVVGAYRHQRSPAPDSFRVHVRILLGNAELRERADDTARGGAEPCARERGRDGAGREDGTDTRNGESAEADEKSTEATERRPRASADGNAAGAIALGRVLGDGAG
jgi:hypothetical protein